MIATGILLFIIGFVGFRLANDGNALRFRIQGPNKWETLWLLVNVAGAAIIAVGMIVWAWRYLP